MMGFPVKYKFHELLVKADSRLEQLASFAVLRVL